MPPLYLFIMDRQQINEVFIDYYGEERVDCQEDKILVYWPSVVIENENGEQHRIVDLYAKISLDGIFMQGIFELIRTTLTMNEWLHHYMHSHTHRIGDVPVWEVPCRGSGPINASICRLQSTGSTIEDWMIFARELDQYVAIESLAGGPYQRMSSLSNPVNNGGYRETKNISSFYEMSRSEGSYVTSTKEDIIKKVLEMQVLPFTYDGRMVIIAEHPLKSLLKIQQIIKDNQLIRINNDTQQPEGTRKWTFTGGMLMSGWNSEIEQNGGNVTGPQDFIGERLVLFKGQWKEFNISDLTTPNEQPDGPHSNEIWFDKRVLDIYHTIILIANKHLINIFNNEYIKSLQSCQKDD